MDRIGKSIHAPEHGRAAPVESIHHAARTAFVVVVNLAAGPFEIAVMVEQIEPAQDLLWTVRHESNDLGGT